jgi:aconitate decarboxylase
MAITTMPAGTQPTDPQGPTGALCTWLGQARLEDVPLEVQQRALHLLLDGVACLLLSSHMEWSALGVEALTDFDRGGGFMVAARDRSTSAFTAAVLNSSFIQSFELDDYFPPAPVHSNSIVVPAMMAVIQDRPVTGAEMLLATILGYEVGTRVGLSLHGPEMLTRGWHSGAVFGGPAAAASAGRLLGLTAAGFEDAIGISATQAAGLMSAQFESMVKRMQHGFASRNGLYAAVLAARGYVGIKRVFERSMAARGR